MDAPKSPLLLANRMFRELVDHAFGGETILSPSDYCVLRVVFRRCGGSWEKACQGDITTLRLLSEIVTAWGKLPKRLQTVETI